MSRKPPNNSGARSMIRIPTIVAAIIAGSVISLVPRPGHCENHNAPGPKGGATLRQANPVNKVQSNATTKSVRPPLATHNYHPAVQPHNQNAYATPGGQFSAFQGQGIG